MSITIKKISFPELSSQAEEKLSLSENYANVIGSLEVECQVRVGTLALSINELRMLKTGQVLSLLQQTDEPLDLLVNNQVIARGELMSVEHHFALLITEVAS